MTIAESVDEAVELCIERTSRSERTIIQAGPGQGKTYTLTRLGERLRDERTVVFVSPPLRELDVAGAALMQIADGLGLNGEGNALVDPERSIVDKTRVLRGELNRRDDVVLLLDGPDSWPPTGDEDDQQARRVVDELLATVAGPIFLSVRRHQPWFVDAAVVRLPERGWRATSDTWPSSLRDAQALLRVREAPLEPIAEKLAVALLALAQSRGDTLSVANLSDDTRALASDLRARLQREHHALMRSWERLGRTRFGLDEQTLDALDAPEPESIEGVVLRDCLLSHRLDGFQLHPALRSNAPGPGAVDVDTHRRLFERFEGAVGYVNRLETVHHGLRAAPDGEVPPVHVLFVEQLDAYGRWLSHVKGDTAAAARVFRRSLDVVPDRAYPQHYLAYNLDVRGEEPHTVEANYRAAVTAQPENAWWHSRLISFLLTRRRIDEARTRFHHALDELKTPERANEPFLYRNLHRWIARDALFFGDLELCAEIIRDVPENLVPTIDTLPQVIRRLAARREARAYGAVAPLGRLGEAWWRRGPQKLPSEVPEIGTLAEWLTARIEDIDGDEVALLGARVTVPPAAERPPTVMTRCPLPQLERAGRAVDERVQVGRYVEVGWYSTGERPAHSLTMVLPAEDDDRLPVPDPHPMRYVQARVRRRRQRPPGDGVTQALQSPQ